MASKVQKKYFKKKFFYPLLDQGFSNDDIKKAISVLKSKRLTMSLKTRDFENYFAKKLKTKYAVMVNSGSSANLLIFFSLLNPLKKNKLKYGDECLVPALCWSTSLWPVLQSGLKPRLIDVNKNSFSLDLKTLKAEVTKKTKAVLLINVLGNCSEIDKIKKFLAKKRIYLIEDNCESLGSIYKNKFLGTFGDFSSFSFYFSHQITSGEGGMILCKNKNDYNLIKVLRAHGWDRDLNKKNSTSFNFINMGFNLRPLEVSAAIGLNQIKRLNKFIANRKENRNQIINCLKKNKKWKNQFDFFLPSKNLKPSWFGLPLLINKKLLKNKNKYLNYLKKQGIESRPIISGNFANQKSIRLFDIRHNKKKLKNAQEIEDRGFFIGLPTKILKKNTIKVLTNHLLKIDKF